MTRRSERTAGLVGLTWSALIVAVIGLLPAMVVAQLDEVSQPHTVEGFRSAKFGATERAVRAAIAKDFDLTGEAIEDIENPVELTRALKVDVNDLLPGGGTASVTYIFGYKSEALVQINVVWGPPIDPDAEPATVINMANQLRGYFLGLGWQQDSVHVNQQLANGSIAVFRAIDADGRLVLLQLNPVRTAAAALTEGEQAPPPRMSLVLSYVMNADEPDIYTIEKGAF